MDPRHPERDGPPTRRFPFDERYDFSYRPETYWPELPTERTLLTKIKGTQRRDIARRALEGQELPRLGGDELYREAMEFVLEESLEHEDRESWGQIHPAMMGGEYLPADLEGEVEIARIELASTTADVIQLRARSGDGRILYRIVDEYWDDGSRYAVTPEESAEPLTFGELIELLDTARQADEAHLHANDAYNLGVVDSYRDLNYLEGSVDAEELVEFVCVNSLYYPQLESYYRDRASEWYQQILLEQLDEEIASLLPANTTVITRPASPARYKPDTLLLHTRRGAPNKGESVVDKVAAERWMRYAAGLDEFELHGSYEREALWVGRLTRVEARWRDEQGQKVTVQLENHARALLPLELENSRGPELLKRDLEAPAIPLSRRVELALAMQRQQEADELLRQLSAEDPFVAAEFFSQLGRQDEALKLYRAAAADKPAMVGWRLLEMDLPDDAEQLFQRARDDADALLGLAAIARRRGDTRTAVALFEQWREAS